MEAGRKSKKENFRETGEYYEIRLESIGGLGANLCAKMLGELGIKYLGLNSASFSSYGSEKTGTPVKGYIRYCDTNKEIRAHSPVEHPDLLVIFHGALTKDEGVFSGCGENTEVILALDGGQMPEDTIPEEISRHITAFKACYAVPAQKIAMETHSRINMVMLGAIARVLGFAKLEDMKKICKDGLGRKYPDALKGNLEGIQRGYEQIREIRRPEKGTAEKRQGGKAGTGNPQKVQKPSGCGWGYDTAPIGGINPRFGSTVAADLSPSRQGYIPVFIKERCINCGLCDSTCPDMVFQFAKGESRGREMMVNQGLDYYHCKGCLRCVDVCPVNALVRGLEEEHPDKQFFMPNQEMVRHPDYYIEAGADGYITSEAYLTEKRMEGGEV